RDVPDALHDGLEHVLAASLRRIARRDRRVARRVAPGSPQLGHAHSPVVESSGGTSARALPEAPRVMVALPARSAPAADDHRTARPPPASGTAPVTKDAASEPGYRTLALSASTEARA